MAISLVPGTVDLDLYAGDGAALRVTVEDAAGDPFPVDGEVVAQVRTTRADTDPFAAFTVDMTDAATGVLVLSLTGEQTDGMLTTPGTGKFGGVWDCQWTADGAEPITLVQGKVTCIPDVTRP